MSASQYARATGWKPNLPGPRPRASALLAGRPARMALAPLEKPSLLRFRGRKLVQGQANSCVGMEKARSVQLYYAANEIEVDLTAAPGDLYGRARRAEFAGWTPEDFPMPPDRGCYPDLMELTFERLGFVRWEDYPYTDDPAHIQRETPRKILEKAYAQRGAQLAVTMETGSSRVERVEYALRHRCPVGFGMQIDGAFFDNRGDTIRSIDPHRIEGGHMMEILEVTPDRNILAETWYENHGLGDQTVLISGDLFGSHFVGDVQILEAAPLP